MSKKNLIYIAGAAIIIIGASIFFMPRQALPPSSVEDEVRVVAYEFGERLKGAASYDDLVSTDLVKFWSEHPEAAPSKTINASTILQIEIVEIHLEDDGAYSVQMKLTEKKGAEFPMALKLRNREGKWIITGISNVGRLE